MKQLNRFEMAAIKRTALNTKKLNKDKAKINEKMQELAGQLIAIQSEIDRWESPIIEKYGKDSSEIIALNGALPEESEAVVEQPVEA